MMAQHTPHNARAIIAHILTPAFTQRQLSSTTADTQALRWFHGAGEVHTVNNAIHAVLRHLSIDRYGDHAWVTLWESQSNAMLAQFDQHVRAALIHFLQQHFAAAVLLYRPHKGVPDDASVLFGNPPSEQYRVSENGAHFLIQLQHTKHPGLFLDHAPLRRWLMTNSQQQRVLNTFAYTGSLSVAAALGGAAHVTTLDLSKATMRWAEANGELNGLTRDRARWIAGDVFEWLPRLQREIAQGKQAAYSMVIADPPSFSRSAKGTFSTAKDLPTLHALLLDVLAPNGILITSINSAQVSWAQYEKAILQAAEQRRCRLQVLQRLEQPDTFPNWLDEQADERYLKGFILRAY